MDDVEQILTVTDELVAAKTGQHLSDLQRAMLRESWSWQRLSYDQIADSYGYSPTYLGLAEKVKIGINQEQMKAIGN